MERAYWATASVGPYREFQVVVFDDAREPDAGWVRTGWFREIVNPKVIVLTEAQSAEFEATYLRRPEGLPEQLRPRRGRPKRRE